MVNTNKIYTKNPDIIFRKIADEFILVPIRQKVVDLKSIYTLNEVAAFIWEQIDEEKTIGQIKELVEQEFDVAPQIIEADIEEIFSQWAVLGMIIEASQA